MRPVLMGREAPLAPGLLWVNAQAGFRGPTGPLAPGKPLLDPRPSGRR